jgi:lysozyme
MKKIFLITSSIVFPVIILYFLFDYGIISFVHPGKQQYSIRGIDISHYQKDINWNELSKNGLRFVYIKATEGDDFTDFKFEDYALKSNKIGLASGAYHFYSLRVSGISQAENFIRNVDDEKIKLPPAVDLEFGGNSSYRPEHKEFEIELDNFLNRIHDHYKKIPVIYTTYEFYNSYLKNINLKNDYNIWIRNIFYKPDKFNGKNWYFWQYNSRGRIKGIKGFVDLNVYNYNEDEFNNMIK